MENEIVDTSTGEVQEPEYDGKLVRVSPFWKTTSKSTRKVYLRSKNLSDDTEKGVYLQIRENTYKGTNNPSGSLFSSEPDVYLMINDNQIDGLIEYLQDLKTQV